MTDGPDLSQEEVMSPERSAALRRRREESEAAYRARFGGAPLQPGDVGEQKWRTPVDFRVVDDPDHGRDGDDDAHGRDR